eukprot:12788261-Alexandrium_andersonii.AAC.1
MELRSCSGAPRSKAGPRNPKLALRHSALTRWRIQCRSSQFIGRAPPSRGPAIQSGSLRSGTGALQSNAEARNPQRVPCNSALTHWPLHFNAGA